MRSSRAQEVSVAVTTLMALLIFAGAVLVLGQENRLFARKVAYRTNFPDAAGVRVGSPVTMAGVRVGGVRRIVLPTDPRSQGIDLFLEIDESFAPRVRQGTHAKLITMQFVANEKAVELNPGDSTRDVLPEGGEIPPEVTQEILEKGKSIADTLEQITVDLRDILQKIKSGDGLIGRAISDPEFGKKGLAELEATLASASRLLQRAERGEGLLGKALADREFADRLSSDLAQSAHSFAALTRRLEAGEGMLGSLTTGEGAEPLLAEIKAAATAFRGAAEALASGEGLAGVLLHDKELAARVAKNLDETLAHSASIARKIDEGQGTLGLLVNERGLHDDVQQLVTGAKGKTLAGRVIRHYYRKGAEERAKRPPATDAPAPGAVVPPPAPAPGGSLHP